MSLQKNHSPRYLQSAIKAFFSPTSSEAFVYQPLKADLFRFLRFGRGGSIGPLQCNIVTDRLLNVKGTYIAISYVWGQNPQLTSIKCDGKALEITENLDHALRAIKRIDQTALVWADAVCINQENDFEKADQLRWMGQLYGGAAKVVIWLGVDDKLAPSAFRMVRHIEDVICHQRGVKCSDLKTRKSLKDMVQGINVRLFPANDSKDWGPIAWLFEQPWFERVWVIQEVSGNENIEVVCGRHAIDWASVALVATWIETNDEYFSKTKSVFRRFRGIYSASFMFDKGRFGDKAWLRLLDEARTFSATKRQDNIFGLLGHPSIQWNEDDGTRGLVADYSKAVSEVFADVAVRHIRQSNSLDMLSQVDHGQNVDDSPEMASWIPRFDRQKWSSALTLNENLQLDACCDTTPVLTGETSGSQLALQGVICGSVAAVSSVAYMGTLDASTGQAIDPIVDFWLEHVEDSRCYPTGESQETAMALTLSAGGNTSRSGLADARFSADFAAYLLPRLKRSERYAPTQTRDKINASLHRLQKTSEGGQASRYADAVANVLLYRRLCLTDQGHYGLGPEAMRNGDSVCVLDGGSVPFVIRPEGPCWMLIGEIFVHGLISGEAVRAVHRGRCQRQKFVFV